MKQIRWSSCYSWQLRHNEGDGVWNHRRLHCLFNCWFRCRSKKTSKLRVTGLCARNSPVTGEFPAHRARNAENISIWWRHYVLNSSVAEAFQCDGATPWNCEHLFDVWSEGPVWLGHTWTTSGRALQWRHNDRDDVSNHRPRECLLNRLFGRRSKKTSKLRVTGLCEGNSPVTGEFPAQMASNAENVSIWWRHHGIPGFTLIREPQHFIFHSLLNWKPAWVFQLPYTIRAALFWQHSNWYYVAFYD